MTSNGFLVLLTRFLLQRFSEDETLRSKDWLFSNTGNKIIVHGPNRNPLADTDILAEITSCPNQTWISIELKDQGTVTDRELLVKIIGSIAPRAKILTSPPEVNSLPSI
jgi:hypothetical protein